MHDRQNLQNRETPGMHHPCSRDHFCIPLRQTCCLTGYVHIVYIHCGTLFDSIFHLPQSKQLTWRNRRSLSGPRKVWCSASHAPCTSPPASHYNINIAPYHIISYHYPIAGLFYRLKQKAFEECRAQGTAYADCCRGRTLSMAWKCRDEMAAYSDCVSQ